MISVQAPKPKLPKVPEYIASSRPYVPGKPVEELERELGITDIIKLASNENPLGPSPKAMAALTDFSEQVRLYPDASHYYLREKLSVLNSVHPDEIIVGNGSNEVLELLVRTFCIPGDNIISCANAFVAYKISAKIHGVEYREHAANAELTADLDEIFALVDDKTRIIFIPNPNNPTGTYVGKAKMQEFLQKMQAKNVLVVLDSAYLEYVFAEDYPDPLEMYRTYTNIVVTRTFSKAYGLSGLRVGYGIAHPSIIEPMIKVKLPFNVTNLSLMAATAAVDDLQHLKLSFEQNQKGLEELSKAMERLGYEYWPSQGNFLLVDFGSRVAELNQYLLHKGIIARPVAGFGLKRHLRISTGTDKNNLQLIKALEAYQMDN